MEYLYLGLDIVKYYNFYSFHFFYNPSSISAVSSCKNSCICNATYDLIFAVLLRYCSLNAQFEYHNTKIALWASNYGNVALLFYFSNSIHLELNNPCMRPFTISSYVKLVSYSYAQSSDCCHFVLFVIHICRFIV